MITDSEVIQLRERVAELEAQVKLLYQHLGLPLGSAPGLATDHPRIIEQIRKGNLIEAIKIHRELYHSDLVGAKKAVEEMKLRLRL